MNYNEETFNCLNKCYLNFQKEKNINLQNTEELKFFIIDDSNKKKYFKYYLYSFLKKPKNIMFYLYEMFALINLKKLSIVCFLLVVFILLIKLNLDNEFSNVLYLTTILLVQIPVYIAYYFTLFKPFYRGYYMKLNEKDFFEEDGVIKKHMIKLMLHTLNDFNDLKFVFYHELHHFYEGLNNIKYSEDNSDEFAKFMINKYHNSDN